MNKTAIAILAVFALAAAALTGVAVAGINPVNFGLPNVQLATGDNNFYNLGVVVPGAQASVMCVACHSRNPGARDAYRTTNGYGYMGSHFVTQFFNDTSKGGGYSDGSGAKVRSTRSATTTYMADNNSNNLNVASGWYGLPKYGWLNGTIPDNTTTPRTATNPQMICESCHNIVRNIGPAKLLAYGMSNGTATSGATGAAKGAQVPVLCIGCHGDMDASLNAEWQLHPLQPSGETWVGTQHHRNTAGTTPPTYFGAGVDIATSTHDMAQVNAAYYGTAPNSGQTINGGSNQMWAAGKGQLGTTAYPDHALAFNASGNTRMRMTTASDNNQIQINAVTQLLCTNCHRAHNADSSAGATILMRGSDTTTVMGTGTVASSVATAYYGVRRMEDKGGRGAAFNSTNPLCLACHL